MDRIFKEEGVIHDDSMSEDDEIKDEPDCHEDGDEVIGHMQSKDGENLGELIVPSKSINKLKVKNKRVMGKLRDENGSGLPRNTKQYFIALKS